MSLSALRSPIGCATLTFCTDRYFKSLLTKFLHQFELSCYVETLRRNQSARNISKAEIKAFVYPLYSENQLTF